MEAANSALEANLELDRKELARVAKEADEVETALATAIRESDVVLVDKVIYDKRIEVNYRTIVQPGRLAVSYQINSS